MGGVGGDVSTLFLDIETLPPPMPLWEGLALDKPPPSNYGPEAAERHRQRVAGEGWRRLSLDPFRAEVACVGWAWDDGEPYVGDLRDFAHAIVTPARFLGPMRVPQRALGSTDGPSVVVGHNLDGFDLPILWAALVRHGYEAAARIVGRWMSGKPWERPTVDTVTATQAWGAYGKSSASLDVLCGLLGVPSPKDGIDGSQVLDVWASGPEGQQRVRDYCAKDVEAVRAVYHRLRETGRIR